MGNLGKLSIFCIPRFQFDPDKNKLTLKTHG